MLAESTLTLRLPLRYRAIFRWDHYEGRRCGSLPRDTTACASVTSAFLQVIHVLYQVERSRDRGSRNVLQVEPRSWSFSSRAGCCRSSRPDWGCRSPAADISGACRCFRRTPDEPRWWNLQAAHTGDGAKLSALLSASVPLLLGCWCSSAGSGAADVLPTAAVIQEQHACRVPDELKKQSITDAEGLQYSTNLDRNRYGDDNQYLATVIRYNLEFLHLCPCLVTVEIINAKSGASTALVAAPERACSCLPNPRRVCSLPCRRLLCIRLAAPNQLVDQASELAREAGLSEP